MINTRILRAEFEYLAPRTVEEALYLLDKYGPEARIIAGGTDLLIQMKQEIAAPRYLIDIAKISGLGSIEEEEGWLRIGAAARWSEVIRFCAARPRYAALTEAAASIGKVQVRNMATIGGNLCTASPAADSAPALLVLDARVRLVEARGERTLDLEDFFKGVRKTAMGQSEIMTEVRIPPIPKGAGSAFAKITRVGADISKISCAVSVGRQGTRCTFCRIAMGAVAPVPLRIKDAEAIAAGREVEPALLEDIGRKVAEEIKPITDIRSTTEYRRAVAGVLARDVLSKAWCRAEEK